VDLTTDQRQIVGAPLNTKLYLSGPAGTGKSTAGVERLRHLINNNINGSSILVLTPQRTLQGSYLEIVQSPEIRAGGVVTPATVGGLARRMCDLFWPLAVESAGFSDLDKPPVFLTLETSQYYMAHIVRPLLDQGYFQSLTIDRNRLYSQIIDNLNKSAAVGFSYLEIGSRLDSGWYGDPSQRRVYADAQDCATRFREFCLAHNLLDFSLQLEVFLTHLWPNPIVHNFLTQNYSHLIYDNPEEDVPRAHDLIREWLPEMESALFIYDEGAGYRRFLGADVDTAWALRDLCNDEIRLHESFVNSENIANLESYLSDALSTTPAILETTTVKKVNIQDCLRIVQTRFYPELLTSISVEIKQLIEEGLSPSEIVVIAPYLSDALRFSLTSRLEENGVPWRSHRPSRSLHDEPASRSLLTLAALAHPAWDLHPQKPDVAHALIQSIEGLDLVRAQLLTDIVYHQKDLLLAPFDGIKTDVQERITFLVGNRYSILREAILANRESDTLPLDHFLRKLFGDILSQPGFGFHRNYDAARIAASLIESVQKFRQVMGQTLDFNGLGKEYISMLNEGVISAQYLESWNNDREEAVLVAPAYTFLMMNRPATIQFWLDAGSNGWYERLSQPLTHPYILSRSWEPGRIWSDADEVKASQDALARLVSGLLRRCRNRVILGLAELGESGFEQRGDLLKGFQKVLQERGT
jgi:superfamily I DNA/RNA helicase